MTRLPASLKDQHQPQYSRFQRGVQRWSNFPNYGWTVRCSCGQWQHRHNGPKSEAAEYHRDHMLAVYEEATR